MEKPETPNEASALGEIASSGSAPFLRAARDLAQARLEGMELRSENAYLKERIAQEEERCSHA